MFHRLTRRLLNRIDTAFEHPPKADLYVEPLENRLMLSTVEIFAAGAENEETMELQIDGEVVQTWNNVGGDANAGQFIQFTYNTPDTITADQVRIAFTNDLYDPPNKDRNLRVDAIVIDGTRYETEDPSVFSTGTWLPDDGIQPGFRESEWLHSNGYFQYAGGSGNGSQIAIRAAGAENEETMQLLIDGVVVQTWNNVGGDANAGQFQTFNYSASEIVSPDQVRIAFTNDFYDPPTTDRNLRIDNISIDGVVFETEHPSVFSTGTWLPDDGIQPGFRQSEWLHTNGYFQYAEIGGNNPGAIALETSVFNVNEADGTVTINVVRSQGTDGVVTVDYRTVDGSATDGEDYVAQSGTLTFVDGQTVASVDVPIIDDEIAESNETFSFTIDNVTGGAILLVPRTATITIADDDVSLPNYSDFAGATNLAINGNTRIAGNVLRLTTAGNDSAGSAYFDDALDFDADTSFQTRFEFRIHGGNGSSGADGLTFVLQNSPDGLGALGGVGGGMGYSGIVNSLAIDFDTYQNPWDQNNNHVSVMVDGNVQNAIVSQTSSLDLNSGAAINAWVDYNGLLNQLAVYLSAGSVKPALPLFSTTVDLAAILGTQAYLGFTAATGGLRNNHDILNWEFNTEVPPPVNDPGANLVSETIFSGLPGVTSIDWSPDGRNMYISQKSGVVRVARDGQLLPTPFVDISDHVNNTHDRGLLDIAVHPDFDNNPYVYLLYTYDPPEVFDNASHPLAGPDQQGNRAGRLTRVTANVNTDYTTAFGTSEQVLLGTNSVWENFNAFVNSTVDFNEPPAGILPDGTNLQDFIATDSESHTVGGVEFGPDGALYVSIGDGTSFNQVDPRTVRVQDIDNLSGKVLRINPINGQGLPDNPFYNGDPAANRSKVYQYGLRNPFRLSIDPGSGQVYVGDVGWTAWEEVNAAGPGANFGWPYYEGGNGVSLRTNGYQDLPEAQEFYASGQPVTAALYALNHSTGINAIILGDFYTGNAYPSEYQGDLFFNDLGQGIVRNINLDGNGEVISVDTFTTGASIVVAIKQGPDGNLYYADLNDGLIGRWVFV